MSYIARLYDASGHFHSEVQLPAIQPALRVLVCQPVLSMMVSDHPQGVAMSYRTREFLFTHQEGPFLLYQECPRRDVSGCDGRPARVVDSETATDEDWEHEVQAMIAEAQRRRVSR